MIWKLLSKILYQQKVKPFIKTLQDPFTAQTQRLQELIRTFQNTMYGKRHRFSDINDYDEYITKVPINQYKDLQPYIQAELKGQQNVLYPEPIFAVMATSGTTGEPKLIPYTATTWKSANRFQLLYFASADNIRPFLQGKLLAIMAPSIYKRTEKWDIGYLTGFGMKHCNPFLKSKIVPHTEVFDILNWEEKFRETIRQAIEQSNISACIGLTSFVMALLRRTKFESLEWLQVDPRLSSKARKRLDASIIDGGSIDLQALWPDMAVVFSSGVVKELYAPVIKDLVGDVHVHEAYAGTEGTYGFQLYEDMRGVVPVVDDILFEFVESQGGALSPYAQAIPLSDVKLNTPYRIVVSTPSGLWRYDVHDLIIFTALDPPVLQCLGKSQNTINISGEKVTEGDISAALTLTSEEQGLLVREFMVAPEISEKGGTYHIFVEFDKSPSQMDAFTRRFDTYLQQINELYYHVRAARTILPAVLHPVPIGTFDSLERQRLKTHNKAIGQTKMPRITSLDQALQNLVHITVPLLG
jgi:hypothetical protein